MPVPITQNQRTRSHSNDVGKNISISFGFHELGLIDDLDLLAHSECVNRSQWIRRRIREGKQKLKEQQEFFGQHQTSWTSLLGDK